MRRFKLFAKCLLLGAALTLGILGDLTVQAQPAVEVWAQQWNASGVMVEFGGSGEKIAVDSSGNVIVAALVNAFGNGPYDGLVIKYSGAGVPLWTNRFPGWVHIPFDESMPIVAVATDGNGNVVVAGRSLDTNGYCFATIKYSGAGVPLWTNRYNDFFAKATAVAVDDNGDVLVAGYPATIKYSGAGIPLWTNYGGANAMAVDGSGNAVITGFGTTKYSSAGVPLWTIPSNGPSDPATALALDSKGNVFVVGSATIKYSGTGIPLWTNFGAANAVAVDGSGNVVVTGVSYVSNAFDYATIKYSDTGVPLWTNFGLSGYPLAAAVDGSGNVFVTGHPGTIKYSGAGMALWTNFGGANAIAIDSSANVFVSGSGTTTIGYSGAGVPLWTNQYLESAIIGGDDKAVAVGVDGNGNVFVTGWSPGTNGYTDYATIKYSGAGVTLWTNRCNGPGVESAAPTALAVDSSGNVFVTGRSPGTNGYGDYATIKYSGAGVPLWTNRYSGPGNDTDYATAVAVDGNGNVVVTGGANDGNGYWAYATIKYSSEGVALWTNRGPSRTSSASGLAVDSSGDVFVTGSVTIKYSGTGIPLWTNYSGASALAVDSNGNVAVTGLSPVTNGYDYATIKYSGAGVALWTNRHNGPGNWSQFAPALAVDSHGDLVVTGSSHGSNGFDYVTIKYSAAGLPLWTNLGPRGSAYAVATDRSGDVLVTGSSGTIKYSGAGVPLWTNRYDESGWDVATALAVDDSGNVFVTGSAIGSDGSYDFLTIKYSPAGLPLLTIARTATNTVALSWPSPSPGFSLDQNTDPANTNWSPVGTTPLDDGITKTVIVNSPVGNRFYRLVHP